MTHIRVMTNDRSLTAKLHSREIPTLNIGVIMNYFFHFSTNSSGLPMQVARYCTMNNGCSVNKKKYVNILGLCVILALLQSAKSILKHCYRSGNSLMILHGRLSQLDLCGGAGDTGYY